MLTSVVLTADEPSLEEVRNALNGGYGNIIASIPRSFAFSEGDISSYIDDGGKDMFDRGNFLNTNLRSQLQYTNSEILTTDAFG